MEQEIKNLHTEITNLQLDRLSKFNDQEARLKKLEADLVIIGNLITSFTDIANQALREIKDLEFRLNKRINEVTLLIPKESKKSRWFKY